MKHPVEAVDAHILFFQTDEVTFGCSGLRIIHFVMPELHDLEICTQLLVDPSKKVQVEGSRVSVRIVVRIQDYTRIFFKVETDKKFIGRIHCGMEFTEE